MRAFALAVILIPALAGCSESAAEKSNNRKFDLACKGMDGRRPEERHYRIDLASGEYCFDECARIMKIAQVSKDTITLYDDKPEGGTTVTSHNTISRLNGAWNLYYNDLVSSMDQDVRGVCVAAPFSGFPAAKF